MSIDEHNPNKILVVDDEPDIRELIVLSLNRLGLECDSAGDVRSALSLLGSRTYSLCFTDMKMPDGTGMDVIKYIQEKNLSVPIAVITAFGNTELAVDALKAGAFDFISKPVKLEELKRLVRAAVKLPASRAARLPHSTRKLLGESTTTQILRETINKVSRSQAPVFIHGESGTGKELVARLIHSQGPRADQPFVPVNCGAIPSELMESEFFGHRKGSFTGAISDKAGLFTTADGGTLFLDEIGELPLAMQVKMLRVIQEKSLRPVGDVSEIPVDVRILSASHRDLQKLVGEGAFRSDLFFRINVISMEVPPLRRRPEDIPVLTDHFLTRLTKHQDDMALSLTPDARNALNNYNYPGNVRELENILERAVAMASGNQIDTEDLALGSASLPGTRSDYRFGEETLDEYLARIEEDAIIQALAKTGNNKTAAAELLGISFRQLRYRVEKLSPAK